MITRRRHIPWARLRIVLVLMLACTALGTFILLLQTELDLRSVFPPAQVQAVPESGAGVVPASSTRPWLLFAIPTVWRAGDMLLTTLDVIDKQLSGQRHHHQIGVMVVKNSKSHPEFDLAKERFGDRQEFVFVQNTNRSVVSAAPLEADMGDDQHPSWKVQSQSLDLVFMLEFVHDNVSPSYFLFMEDDFSICADGLNAITHLIEKSNQHFPDWIGLLFSEGMNGIVLKREDLRAFAWYLKEHHKRRPPDHLIIEWLAGETEQSASYRNGRPHISFRYNLLQHRGEDSTLRAAKAFIADTCYRVNDESRMFEVVSFKTDQCGYDDIWPCPSTPSNTWSPPSLQ